ncbi:MAG: polyamine ABC transporter substrate-binding protein [Pseudomonadota bacterium]|jgi:putrescine transport system substrate-binding protein
MRQILPPAAMLAPLFALALSACGHPQTPADAASGAPGPAAAAKQLNVYNWSDYIAEDTIARFERETGIKVVYDVYDSNEMLEAKLLAGSSGYDVVFPSARPFAQRHVAANLYLPLDRAQLGNWSNLDPNVLAALQDVDPGNRFLMPYMWGTTGIGYNVAKVRERLGPDFPLDSWNLIFDPAVAAKLADCGIALLDDEQEGFAAALIWLGRDPNGVGGGEIEAAADLFARVRPSVRYFHSSKYIDDLANGEVCVAMAYSGDALMAGDRAEEAGNGVEIAYFIPREGAVRWVDNAAVPADAPHVANAHAFLDFLMRPDVMAPISEYVSYASANAAATPLVDEAVRGDTAIYPPAEVLARLVDPKKLPEAENRARVRAWTSIKSGS